MRPRIFMRCSSSLSSLKPRKGRKDHLYIPEREHPPPTPEEEVRITLRRHKKAERDERMDITLALTPPKTYMGGFTRPRDIRASNWFPGGAYVRRGKVYESPPESAYKPHTVFLLETRYRVRHSVGRVDAYDHITGVCRAVDFVKLMTKYNRKNCPPDARESLDNACWPFIPKSGKVLKPTKWWGPEENLEEIMKEIYESKDYDQDAVNRALTESVEEEDEDDGEQAVSMQQKTKRKGPAQHHSDPSLPSTPVPSSHLSLSSQISPLVTTPPTELRDHTSPSSTGDNITPSSPPTPSQPILSQQLSRISDGRLLPPLIHPKRLPAFDKEHIRAQYLPLLASEPFWRPLLAFTVSTRSLALTLSRLAKAHERGLPYHAAMSNDDRKCLFSVSSRMRNYRLNRFLQLTRAATMRLAGYKGGFVGIRFGVNERGRGINGEGLADPIPFDKRVVKVLVGRWYRRAHEVYQSYEEGGLEWGGEGAVDIAYMNEWGHRLDVNGNEIPLTAEEQLEGDIREVDDVDTQDEDEEDDEYESTLRRPLDPIRKNRLKPALRLETDEAATLRRKLALMRAQTHSSVQRV